MQNTKDFEYLLSIENDASLTYREIKQTIYKTTLDKALKHTRYTNRIVRRLINNASKQIRSLFKRYFQKRIQSTQFKSATTIVLRKLNKKDYFNAKTYRSIALLNTLNKILEFIVSKCLRSVVETCDSISNTQIKVCRYRLTNTILQLITKKIHTIQSDTRRKIVSLLNLDRESAFDNITHNRLLHNMRKRRVLKLFFEFVENFLKDRRITITIDNYTTTKRKINVDIS